MFAFVKDFKMQQLFVLSIVSEQDYRMQSECGPLQFVNVTETETFAFTHTREFLL